MQISCFTGTSDNGVRYIPQMKKVPGKIILVSGPSGVGKGSIISRLLADPEIQDRLCMAPSITTRPPRPGETIRLSQRILKPFRQGFLRASGLLFHLLGKPSSSSAKAIPEKQYRFVSTNRFNRLLQRGELLQWVCYDNNWYGSLAKDWLSRFKKGKHLLFELSSPHALKLKSCYPGKITTIFIAPPSPEEETLRKRLIKRGTNSPESIAERLRKAKEELALKPQFDAVVINEENQFDKAVTAMKEIIMRQLSPTLRFMGIRKADAA